MNPDLSLLSSAVAHRPRRDKGGGAYQSARRYVDFVVNGTSLGQSMANAGYDLVSVFTAEWENACILEAKQRLLLQRDSDFPDGRRSLYVCGECGGLECGAVSIIVEFQNESVIWRSFGYENTWEEIVRIEKLRDIGPFRFPLASYRKVIEAAAELLNQSPEN
jgi:hypothetical protein